MPLYEYKCNDCDKVFEELVFGNSHEPLPCPECSSGNTKKIMSAGNIGTGSIKEPACASTCDSPSSCHSGGTCPMQ
jgi:putative FmdB family regulatory protein